LEEQGNAPSEIFIGQLVNSLISNTPLGVAGLDAEMIMPHGDDIAPGPFCCKTASGGAQGRFGIDQCPLHLLGTPHFASIIVTREVLFIPTAIDINNHALTVSLIRSSQFPALQEELMGTGITMLSGGVD
jgi:hypothetical protein